LGSPLRLFEAPADFKQVRARGQRAPPTIGDPAAKAKSTYYQQENAFSAHKKRFCPLRQANMLVGQRRYQDPENFRADGIYRFRSFGPAILSWRGENAQWPSQDTPL